MRSQRVVAAAVRDVGVVWYEYQLKGDSPKATGFEKVYPNNGSAGPKWLKASFGDDIFATIIEVVIDGRMDKSGRATTAVAGLPTIRFLKGYDMRDSDLAAIGQSTSIIGLFLSGDFTDEGMSHIAAMPQLELLVIDSDRITNESLSQFTNLGKVRTLSISGEFLTDRAFAKIAAMPSIEQLSASGKGISKEGIEAFKRLRPTCSVAK